MLSPVEIDSNVSRSHNSIGWPFGYLLTHRELGAVAVRSARSIPRGLTRNHVLRALADLDSKAEPPFGAPTGYELVHDGRRYPPTAVVGLVFRHLTGRILQSKDFGGDKAPGQANFVLQELGFTVENEDAGSPSKAAEEIRGPSRRSRNGDRHQAGAISSLALDEYQNAGSIRIASNLRPEMI
jgi:hypothetical protein